VWDSNKMDERVRGELRVQRGLGGVMRVLEGLVPP
jgi:hypothetical protein